MMSFSRFRAWLFALLSVLFGVSASAEEPKPGVVRVACIGDSITFGAGVKDRDKNCYPAVLGRLLGEKYEVRNFGVSGATLMARGDKPYIKEKAWQAAKDFKPNIVIIKLGTNDTKPHNWKHEADFVSDLKQMIAELQSLESKPAIKLCNPVPAFPGNFGIADDRIKGGVLPKIAAVAKETGLPVIDLYGTLAGKAELVPDKVHPNVEGAKIIAETVHRALTATK